MRILIRSMLAVAVLLFGATSASAWTFTQSARTNPTETGGVPTLSSLTSTATFIIDVFFSTDTTGESGLQNFSVGLLYDQGGLTYDGVASAALPVVYPALGANTNGNQPGIIMFTPGDVLYGIPTTFMRSTQNPHANWNGGNQPGKLQVNLDYADPALEQNRASATNVWIASLVFHVEPGWLGGTIDLVLNSAQGNFIFANGDDTLGSTAILGGPITLITHVPEPATAALIGLGILGLAVAGRRR